MWRILVYAGCWMLMMACGANDNPYDASGIFEATEVVVSAETNGAVKRLRLQEGDVLTEGQCVGFVDTVQLYLKQQMLEANLQAIRSRVTDVDKQVAATREQMVKAEKERDRFQSLLEQNAGTQKQVDDMESQLAVLRRQLDAQLSAMSSGNQAIYAEQMAVEAQLGQVKDWLEKSYIRTPVAGTVLEKYVEQGELTAVGRPLFKVANLETLYLRAYLTADQITRVRLGQDVKVYADFGEKDRRVYEGHLVWISGEAEFTPKTIQTRDERANLVYAVKISVRNDRYLKIGMYGEVDLF